MYFVWLLQCCLISMLRLRPNEAYCKLREPITPVPVTPSTTESPTTFQQLSLSSEDEDETYIVSDKCTSLSNDSCACTLAKCYFSKMANLCVRYTLEECKGNWFHTNCQRRNVFYSNSGDLCYNTEIEGNRQSNCTRQMLRYVDVEMGTYELAKTQNGHTFVKLSSKRLHKPQSQKGNDECCIFESSIDTGNYEACITISKNELSRDVNKIITFYVQEILAVNTVEVSILISMAMDDIEICVPFTVNIEGTQGELLVPGFNMSTFTAQNKDSMFYYKLCDGGCQVLENRRGKPYPVKLVVYKLTA